MGIFEQLLSEIMQVGQQVVCIDDQFSGKLVKLLLEKPVLGVMYTIRAVYMGRSNKDDSPEVGVLLNELHNPIDPRHAGKSEMGFNEIRFKPLEELSDIDRENIQLTVEARAGERDREPISVEELKHV